jgi:hypothetical protein
MRIIIIILTLTALLQSQFFLDNIPPLPAPSGDIVNVSTAAELNQAILDAQAGQTILIADGTYEMISYVPLNINVPDLTIRGASDDPTKAILKGNGFKSGEKIDLFRVFSTGTVFAYITVEDVRSYGMMMRTGANDDMLIHGCRWIDCNKRCLKGPLWVGDPDSVVPESHNGIIRYCLFEQKTPITLDIPNLDFNGDYVSGMDMQRLVGWHIHHNVFKNFKGISGGGRGAVFLWGGGKGGKCRKMIVENNVFLNNDCSIALGNPSGIFDVESTIVRNNFVVGGAYYGLELANCKDVQAYNNTFFHSNTDSRMVHFDNCSTGVVMKNNISVGRVIQHGGELPDTTGNIWLRTNISGWFQDAVNGDLHLVSTATQAIDKGIVLAEVPNDFDDKPRDANPDMGADEYGNENVSVLWNSGDRFVPWSIEAYPNPFRTSVDISLVRSASFVVRSGKMEIGIFDIRGRLMSTFPRTTNYEPRTKYTWHPRNQPAGIYLIQVQTHDRTLTKQVILNK